MGTKVTPKRNQIRPIDPDPTTIVFLILAAISSAGTVIQVAQNVAAEKRRRKTLRRLISQWRSNVDLIRRDVEEFRNFLQAVSPAEKLEYAIGYSMKLTPSDIYTYTQFVNRIATLVKDIHRVSTKIHEAITHAERYFLSKNNELDAIVHELERRYLKGMNEIKFRMELNEIIEQLVTVLKQLDKLGVYLESNE